jgi:hypothetical protein
MHNVPQTSLLTVAKAKLSAHTLMFLNDIKVSINGVPPPWLRQDEKPGPAKKHRHDNTESERHSRGNDTHSRSTPPQRDGGTEVAGRNMSDPPIFAQSSEVNDLLRKHPTVQLGMVAEAAGFVNTGAMPTEGLPPKSCLRWICFGNVPTPVACGIIFLLWTMQWQPPCSVPCYQASTTQEHSLGTPAD